MALIAPLPIDTATLVTRWIETFVVKTLVKAGYTSLVSAFARKAEETGNAMLLAADYVALEVEELTARKQAARLPEITQVPPYP